MFSSSKVFKVLKDGETFALKEIEIEAHKTENLEQFLNEVALLEQMKNNPYIIQLVDSSIRHKGGMAYIRVVMEHGEIGMIELLM